MLNISFFGGKDTKYQPMKKYNTFDEIKKNDIQIFTGLENEFSFSPHPEIEINPLWVSRFGITNPDPSYYIKRDCSPCFILEYIVSGVGYLNINGQKYRLEAGDVYLIHPGDSCEYYADKENPYKKYWINFACMMFFSELIKAYGIDDRIIRGLDISGRFEEIFKLEKVSDLNDELYIPISRILFSVMMDIAEHKQKHSELTRGDIAYAVKKMLNSSVTTPISLDDIAASFFHSKNDVIRKFKKKYGVTPYSYLVDMRIRRGKNLLINTDKTLSEIAAVLCFSSEYHFSNTFKKKVGISPKEYRRSRK